MYRIVPYIVLFGLSWLFQAFLFDNLTVSIYLAPMVYIAFIALLPITTPKIVMLLLGLAMGVANDYSMGTAGINTISTLLIAFLRWWIIVAFIGSESAKEGGEPSMERFGAKKFILYIFTLATIHHTIFFLFEALSFSNILPILMRLAISTATTTLFVWAAARIFNNRGAVL